MRSGMFSKSCVITIYQEIYTGFVSHHFISISPGLSQCILKCEEFFFSEINLVD